MIMADQDLAEPLRDFCAGDGRFMPAGLGFHLHCRQANVCIQDTQEFYVLQKKDYLDILHQCSILLLLKNPLNWNVVAS